MGTGKSMGVAWKLTGSDDDGQMGFACLHSLGVWSMLCQGTEMSGGGTLNPNVGRE
jgi:hypothetical protein